MPWIIDKDYLPEPGAKEGTNANAVGVAGPHDYRGDGSELKVRFRMYDSDGVLYYEGRAHAASFEPLDHFGKPNAGCTTIKYLRPADKHARGPEIAARLDLLIGRVMTPAGADALPGFSRQLYELAQQLRLDWREL